MPYLRLYAGDVPVEKKRVIARKLIDITLRTFHLSPEERHRITVQFVPLRQLRESETIAPSGLEPTAVAVEVSDRDLTEEKKRAFAAEVEPMLNNSVPVKSRGRFARLLGLHPDPARQIAFQFRDLQNTEDKAGRMLANDFPHAA